MMLQVGAQAPDFVLPCTDELLPISLALAGSWCPSPFTWRPARFSGLAKCSLSSWTTTRGGAGRGGSGYQCRRPGGMTGVLAAAGRSPPSPLASDERLEAAEAVRVVNEMGRRFPVGGLRDW